MADTTILTNAGRNAEAAAIAGGTALVIAELAWGDGDRYPAGGETALLSETGRKAVQAQGVPEGTLNQAFFRVFLDENEGPYVVREIGLIADDGTLIALGRLDTPLNKPIGWTGTISMIVAFSNLESLVIQIDSVSAFVPQERRVNTGDGLTGGGDLSQDRTIEVNFASAAQVEAGSSSGTAVSPAALAPALAKKANVDTPTFTTGAFAPTPAVGENSTRLATTAWVRAAMATLAAAAGFYMSSSGGNGFVKFPSWLGGLMLQWGQADITPGMYVTLPTSFTEGFYGLTVADWNSDGTVGSSHIIGWRRIGSSLSQFQAYVTDTDGTFSGNSAFTYLAIGK